MTEVRGEPVPEQAALELVAIDMGYGHLRPAHSIAEFLEAEILLTDEPPLATRAERTRWRRARGVYEALSRASGLPLVGWPFSGLLRRITHIEPLVPGKDLSQPTRETRWLAREGLRGMGRTLADRLRAKDVALLTTFYAPAVLAELHGAKRIFCVVTDSDMHRVWVPADPSRSHIVYLVPSEQAERRLLAYGVSAERIHVTGFPLPHSLVGGLDDRSFKRNLERRLAALDPHLAPPLPLTASAISDAPPLHLVFAVGGAGAQSELAGRFLPSLRPLIESGRLRLTLVAGVRQDVRATFEAAVRRAGLKNAPGDPIRILFASSLSAYFDAFHRLLVETDVLWTKPSELCFYAALGLPLILSSPVGAHEEENLRFTLEAGAAVRQGRPESAAAWLTRLHEDGTLARAARAGASHLPRHGLYRTVELVLGRSELEQALGRKMLPACPPPGL